MHKELEGLCRALESIATAVKTGWTGDQTFNEAWGWNCPTVSRHDVAALASSLAEDITDANPEDLEEPLLTLVKDYPRRLQHMQTTTVPQFWGGNNGPAVAAYTATIESIRQSLIPLIGWQLLPNSKAMPGHIARRLLSIKNEIEQLVPNKEQLSIQLADINKAHQAAETLPLDLQTLADSRDRAVRLADEASIATEKAKTSATAASEKFKSISTHDEEAKKLVSQCEEAYRITTTKGLAAAFDQRALRLGYSMWVWVLGLILALGFGAYMGAHRIEILSLAVSTPDPQWGAIWIQIVLSALSIGAPVWFSWLATKQIGQRFRLAEDYAFKASVAKAYEGYRKEAARFDSDFEARLFGSALLD